MGARKALTAGALAGALVVAVVAVTADISLAFLGDSTSGGANTFATDTLDPPTGVGAISSDRHRRRIGISWTATADTYATGYRILSGATTSGPYTRVGSVKGRTTTTFQDTALITGNTYYYVVRSYTSSWESANSNESSAQAP